MYAFTLPPEGVLAEHAPGCSLYRAGSPKWRELAKIDGTASTNLIRSLIRKCLMVRCISRGLQLSSDERYAYFPNELLENERLTFRSYTGRQTWVAVAGERKFGSGRFRYQLGLSFWVRYDVVSESIVPDHLVVETKIVLHISDPGLPALEGKALNARRKKIAKSWWNHEWLSRQIAVIQYLAEGGSDIVIGTLPEEQVHISASALSTEVTPSINDQALKAFSAKIDAMGAVLGVTSGEQSLEATNHSDWEGIDVSTDAESDALSAAQEQGE